MTRVLSRWLVERGGLVALVALSLYVWVAPNHLSSGDNAEFATLGNIGGAAHPTGYPLYLLWLRAWSWLPVEPAHAMALATCLLGAASLLVLHAACRAWGATATAASLAVAMLAGVPVIVRLHSEAEVFALNGLVAGAVLWLAAEGGPLRGLPRALALGMVAGLGLANHVTCVLLAPIGLFGVVQASRETARPRAGLLVLGAAVGGLCVGLTPYAYLLITPETRGSWGKIDGLGELVRHFLRMDYGGPGELAAVDRGGTPGDNVAFLFASHFRGWLWAPFALGVVVLAARCLGRGLTRLSHVAWILLTVSWLLAGVGLVSRFNLPPRGVHAFITQRFHMLPLIVFAIPVAIGFDEVGKRLAALRHFNVARSPWARAVLSVLVMATLIAVALPRITGARSPAIEQSLKNSLRTLPPNAVLIGTPDELNFGMAYLQGVLGERPDVTIIAWPQVGLAYARARIERAIGVSIENLPPGSDEKLSVVVAAQVLATDRPLFIDPYQANIATSYPIYPYGLLFRVLPRGTPPPSIEELFAINEALYARYEFGYPTPNTADIVPANIHGHYARTWHVIADGLGAAGKPELQRRAMEMALALAPED
jgi:hypothetical protein